MRYLKVVIVICCLSFFKITYSQIDSLIIIEELEVEWGHPISINQGEYHWSKGLDGLQERDSIITDSIDRLFYSINYYLEKDTCLQDEIKKEMKKELKSLEKAYNEYLNSMWSLDYLSYGRGTMAGIGCLTTKVILQEEFLKYMKYWANSLEGAYLEKNVFKCGDWPNPAD